jgi:hypothetical protein
VLYGVVRTLVAALELVFLRPAESSLIRKLRQAESYQVCTGPTAVVTTRGAVSRQTWRALLLVVAGVAGGRAAD